MNRQDFRSLLLVGALSVATAGSLAFVVRADGPSSDAVESTKPRAAEPAAARSASKPAPASATKPAAGARATTRPSTRAGRELSSEEMMSQLLKPPAAQPGGGKPLAPLPGALSGRRDKTSGPGAVAPSAPSVNVLREGTFLVDRVGRLSRSADGSQAEFAFESDGTALQDPPVVIIPNLKLMQMEDAATNSVRDLRFRVSGMLTEYRGRNYILLEKVVVIPDVLDKF